jgi:hypothetical protein
LKALPMLKLCEPIVKCVCIYHQHQYATKIVMPPTLTLFDPMIWRVCIRQSVCIPTPQHCTLFRVNVHY